MTFLVRNGRDLTAFGLVLVLVHTYTHSFVGSTGQRGSRFPGGALVADRVPTSFGLRLYL